MSATERATLVEFLTARIEEDEERAQVAQREGAALEVARLPTVTFAHVVAWGPARVLAECEAKRRIVRRSLAADDAMDDTLDDGSYFIRMASRDSWRLALSDLALPYADHPGYDPEWRP